MNLSRFLLSTYAKVAPPSREEVLSIIQKKIRLRPGELRRGWMVKAAAWVKKRHIDRGDKKVGVFNQHGEFNILEVSYLHGEHLHGHSEGGVIFFQASSRFSLSLSQNLKPVYIVPDLSNCKLKPFVHHEPSNL